MAGTEGPTQPKNFGELVTTLERGFDSLANQVMGTDEFSQGMNVLQNTRLGLKQVVQDGMQAHLERINMPSREDLLRVAEAVQSLDRRMARMERMLGRLAQGAAPDESVAVVSGSASGTRTAGPARPPRTRKPPSQRASATEG